jgi:hypothetical protein
MHRQENVGAVEELVSIRGVGDQLEFPSVSVAAEELWALAKSYKTTNGHLAKKDQRGGEFEAKACEVLHRRLPLPRRVAGDRDFWSWLTFAAEDGRFASLVDWRFGLEAHPANYGVTTPGSFREGLFARLWWRADIGFVHDETDPYQLARYGDQDIWRSHIFRTRYGRNREFARSFLTTIYNGAERKQPLAVEREMAKLARARHAGTALEVLDAPQKDSLLSGILAEAQALKAPAESS